MSAIISALRAQGAHTFKRACGPCRVKYCDSGSLSFEKLKELFSKKIDALVIEGYLRDSTLETSQRLYASYQSSMNKFPIDQVYSGFACEETIDRPKLAPWYDKVAVKSLSHMRQEAHPELLFMDKLRLELDEQIPSGAMIEHVEGKKRGAYIARAYGSQSKSLLETRAIPASMRPTDLNINILALQMLVTPSIGGSLQLYPNLLNAEEQTALAEKKLEILPNALPEPAATIKAFAGRLVLMNADIPFKIETIESVMIGSSDPQKMPPYEKDIGLAVIESYLLFKGDTKPMGIMR